ncbi:MAG TPA: hypothetical protein PLS34_11690 [Gammaproteobacteria bacterium]|nr:hypothetical protein [Gammaproteobacteria bacterium]
MPTSKNRRRKPKRKASRPGTHRPHVAMARPPLGRGPGPGTEADVRAVLNRHDCKIPYHTVRARFMGAIATPTPNVHPLAVVQSLWGGELPECRDLEEAQALLDTLVMGLWNRLSIHQEPSRPFRLARLEPPNSSDSITPYVTTRIEELEAFVEGLFGGDNAMDLPESAHEALGVLRDFLSFFYGYRQFAAEITTPAKLAEAALRMRQLTEASEAEIHTIIRSCTRARRAALGGGAQP